MALTTKQEKWLSLVTKFGVSTGLQYRANAVFVSKYNPFSDHADLPAAYAALPGTGGTIVLDNINPGDPTYLGSITIAKPNVTIVGTSSPILNWDTETVLNSTAKIEGTVLVQANGFTAEKCVFQTLVTAGDGLQLRPAGFVADNTNVGAVYLQGAEIHDCAFLGYGRTSAYHGLLIEDYQHVNFSNIQTIRNTWGVAVKSSHVRGENVKGKNHSNGGLVTKADFGKTVFDVTISNIVYESTVDGSGNFGGGVWVQNYSALSHLVSITYNNVMIRNGTFNLSNANGSPTDGMDAITVNGLNVNNIGQTQLDCISLNNAVCTGTVTITNCKLRGGLKSINDVSLVFKKLVIPFPDYDKAVVAILNLSDAPTPFAYTKLGFVSGVNMTFLNIVYTGQDTNYFELICNTHGATMYAVGKFEIKVTYNVINGSQGLVDIAPVWFQTSAVIGHTITGMTIKASVNPGTKTIQLGFSAINNFPSEFMNLTYTLHPKGVTAEIQPLPQ